MKFLLLLLLSFNYIHSQEINQLDEKGNKHGVWKGFYEESKRPRYEGTFEHGKETGVFTYYDDTKAKSIIATRTFNPKKNSAYTIFYDQKKNVVSEGNTINKLNEGEWKYFHKESKIIMTTENYRKGKLNGKRTVFYPNSKIAEEVNYVDDLKEGNYKKYSEKGIILEDSNYKKGLYEGQAIYRDPEGNIAAEGKYVANKKSGIWKFYVNGKLESTENMSYPQNKSKKRAEEKAK